ncbi:MAG: 23S rRNA (adenine(2503)-C(2))-methyltransferase RlmN [Oscillospiraceae bacterium]|nr:23S rRNA (adenine(2503)-C(2))-methyltransferase RlmN [Oscillospiraceae bacterium]
MKTDIKSMHLHELEDYFINAGHQKFRAKQVFSWLHAGVHSFHDMTDLSLELREKLDNDFFITVPELIQKQVSEKDGTAKYLWRVQDDDLVESVLMQYSHGDTICISTQVGCRMGCTFCASTIDGFKRNLTASEMLDQVLFTGHDTKKRISNVVLMGIGEPLDNFDNVMRFIKLICHPSGLNTGARHLTLSTCGLVENIDKLAEYDVQLTLAISLHAPDDETRSMLIPYNRQASISKLLDSSERYFKKTGRRVTYEYALINEINDTAEHAKKLVSLLQYTTGHLNLINLSRVKDRMLKPSSKRNTKLFTDILRAGNINFTVRRSLGLDIEAACGQLRRRTMQIADK